MGLRPTNGYESRGRLLHRKQMVYVRLSREYHMGLRPTNGDENRLGPTLYYESGVER